MSSEEDRAFVQRALRIGIVALTVLGVLGVALWVLKGALTPLAVAFLLAYLLDPVIDRFQSAGLPRPGGVLLLLVVAGAALLGVAFVGIPAMQREVADLAARLPGYLEGGLNALAPMLQERFGVRLPATWREGLEALRGGDFSAQLQAAHALLGRMLGALTGTVGALVSIVVIPVLSYYLLVDFDRIRLAALDLVPRVQQDRVAALAGRVDRLVAGFIRGQLSVCAVLGTLYALGFAAIGIDLAFVIGALSGVLAIIPYVGGAVALASAAGMCVLQYGFDIHLGLVVGWYALVQALEGMVLTPRIVGASLGMHPLVVILALLIGGDLFGFFGLMIAVPGAAIAQVFLGDLVDWYRASPLYAGGPAE